MVHPQGAQGEGFVAEIQAGLSPAHAPRQPGEKRYPDRDVMGI